MSNSIKITANNENGKIYDILVNSTSKYVYRNTPHGPVLRADDTSLYSLPITKIEKIEAEIMAEIAKI